MADPCTVQPSATSNAADAMLDVLPIGIVVVPGTGIQDTRYDRRTIHFTDFVHLTAAMIWLR